jgi:hypothetical protein
VCVCGKSFYIVKQLTLRLYIIWLQQVVVSNSVLCSCVLESRGESCSASNFPSFVPMLRSFDANLSRF